MKRLESQDIYPRRYFYPCLEALPYIESNSCPNAEDIARRVLCLPLYTALQEEDLKKIVIIINND
jgi:dTDP-4-amino-4,6-dideoxygalactose transaminase